MIFTVIVNDDDGLTPKPEVLAKCGWTPWMSGHRPSPSGEMETLTALRKSEAFCATHDITATECQSVGGQALDQQVQVRLVSESGSSTRACPYVN